MSSPDPGSALASGPLAEGPGGGGGGTSVMPGLGGGGGGGCSFGRVIPGVSVPLGGGSSAGAGRGACGCGCSCRGADAGASWRGGGGGGDGLVVVVVGPVQMPRMQLASADQVALTVRPVATRATTAVARALEKGRGDIAPRFLHDRLSLSPLLVAKGKRQVVQVADDVDALGHLRLEGGHRSRTGARCSAGWRGRRCEPPAACLTFRPVET